MDLRALTLAFAVALPAAVVAHPSAPGGGAATAEAAVSVLMSLDELVAGSDYVLVGTALDRYSKWEELAGGRRIVTYTRVRVDRRVVGEPNAEVWVRTLGGVVGKIGQSVSGEAQLDVGAKSLLFLLKVDPAVMVVAGLAPAAARGPDVHRRARRHEDRRRSRSPRLGGDRQGRRPPRLAAGDGEAPQGSVGEGKAGLQT